MRRLRRKQSRSELDPSGGDTPLRVGIICRNVRSDGITMALLLCHPCEHIFIPVVGGGVHARGWTLDALIVTAEAARHPACAETWPIALMALQGV